jgi:hypothetical protein
MNTFFAWPFWRDVLCDFCRQDGRRMRLRIPLAAARDSRISCRSSTACNRTARPASREGNCLAAGDDRDTLSRMLASLACHGVRMTGDSHFTADSGEFRSSRHPNLLRDGRNRSGRLLPVFAAHERVVRCMCRGAASFPANHRKLTRQGLSPCHRMRSKEASGLASTAKRTNTGSAVGTTSCIDNWWSRTKKH